MTGRGAERCLAGVVEGRRRRLPPWASGVLVDSYEPLFAYWEEARRLGREDLVDASMLSENDFNKLRRLVERGPSSALELLGVLMDSFEGRIDKDVASRVAEALGLPVERGEARRFIARLLASWLLEAGDYWGIVRLRKLWAPPPSSGEE